MFVRNGEVGWIDLEEALFKQPAVSAWDKMYAAACAFCKPFVKFAARFEWRFQTWIASGFRGVVALSLANC